MPNPNPSQRIETTRLTWALVASTSRAPVTPVRRRTGWTRSAARRRAAQSRTPRVRVLRKGLHRQPARQRRAPARESARAGEGGDGGAGHFLRPESRHRSRGERRGGRNDARVQGRSRCRPFWSREACGRPSDSDPTARGRRGGDRASFGPRGARRRAGLAAWPSAVGPQAQVGTDRPDPGRKVVWAASTDTFHLYSEAFSYYFVNIFLSLFKFEPTR